MLTRLLLPAAAVALAASAQTPATLPAVHINSTRVANQAPVGVAAMPVSALRFEPRVDVQARNLAEGQADVALRGGIFENTGFRIGAVSLYDPQTGHYLAELPLAPAMLAPPEVVVGADNALRGFNAGVGTIASGWRPIRDRGEASVAFGDHGFNQQSFYEGRVYRQRVAGLTVAADVEWARSESDGSRPFGEHDFDRVAGRLQLQGAASQTDLYAAYQAKFFGWPNLYTPFGFNETENLQTVLFALNHRASYGANGGSWWQAGAYYRRNKDDYEFNRAVPGASNPFQHTTRVQGAAVEGRHAAGAAAVAYHAAWMRDRLQSTALTAGRFNRREYVRVGVVPELGRDLPAGHATLRAGAVFDDTDRDASRVSPILGLELRRPAGAHPSRIYFEYAETSQVPTYTALNSSATAGLFRGNPNLGRETMRNLEIGAGWTAGAWTLEAALFRRWDDELVDWTFRRGVVARTANPVDLEVTGVELVGARRGKHVDLVLSYAWLDKDADYGGAAVDASFYALNFARHRVTAAVTWRVGAGFELRADNELRWQEANSLRTVGGDQAVLTSVGLHYLPRRLPALELSVQVDNLWDDDFQEVPAVPSARRQFAAGATWRW
ncbi:MAG TPA: TonB-dependent receptor [Opitutaceae bacterium]|nr:TonB-dependent receptor [Opitutaceae bacterium]